MNADRRSTVLAVHLAIWRVQLARTLAWALLLGLGRLAQALSAGPLEALSLLSLWLLALGGFAALIGRLASSRRLLCALLMSAGLWAARSLFVATHGGGFAALLPTLLARALVVALASSAVRACRFRAPACRRSPGGMWRSVRWQRCRRWSARCDPRGGCSRC